MQLAKSAALPPLPDMIQPYEIEAELLAFLRRDIFSELGQTCRLEHLPNSGDHLSKTFQHDANMLLFDPLCVIALLRKRPRIAFDQHWEIGRAHV